jgi:hypothetical protein
LGVGGAKKGLTTFTGEIAKKCDLEGVNVAMIRHKVQLFAPDGKVISGFWISNPGTEIQIFGL